MIWAAVIGGILVLVFAMSRSSSKTAKAIREAQENELQAQKEERENAAFDRSIELRVKSLRDEIKLAASPEFKNLSDNQLFETIELSARNYNKELSELWAAPFFLFFILVLSGAGAGYYWQSWLVFGGLAAVGGMLFVFSYSKMDASLEKKYREMGFSTEKLKIE